MREMRWEDGEEHGRGQRVWDKRGKETGTEEIYIYIYIKIYIYI